MIFFRKKLISIALATLFFASGAHQLHAAKKSGPKLNLKRLMCLLALLQGASADQLAEEQADMCPAKNIPTDADVSPDKFLGSPAYTDEFSFSPTYPEEFPFLLANFQVPTKKQKQEEQEELSSIDKHETMRLWTDWLKKKRCNDCITRRAWDILKWAFCIDYCS